MPRTLLLIAALALCSCDDTIENIRPGSPFAKIGYDDYNAYIFQLKESDKDDQPIRTDTIGLFCSDHPSENLNGQLPSQWQFVSRKDGENYSISGDEHPDISGIEVTDSTLFIHPPRFGRLRILQFVPYPNFKNFSRVGNEWAWDFEIGGYWTIDSLYPLMDTSEVFHIVYKLADTVKMATPFGKLFCYHVTAVSTSRFGISTASYYVNSVYGLVKYALLTTNKLHYDFTLIEQQKGIERMAYNEEWLRRYQQAQLSKVGKTWH